MFIKFDQVPGGVTATVKVLGTVLTIPAGATHAEVQASLNHVRYTCDSTNPPTTTFGHLLRTTDPPKLFLIEDILRMRVIRDGATSADLFVHFMGTS